MGSLANQYRLLKLSKSIDLENAVEFLLTVYPICNDGLTLDENIAIKAIQSPFSSHIFSHYIDMIDGDPAKFGLAITRLYNRDGELLRISVEDVKPNNE